jgi:hypothetical protein
MPRSIALLAVLLSLVACGGDDDGVNLSGDTPDEAAGEIADATCQRLVECGGWDFEIETDDNGDITACTPIQEDVDHAACVADQRAEILDDLECAMPTDDELAQIAECINDVIAADCVTEEELQAYCDALLSGEDPPEPGEAPSSCDALDTILEGCQGVL